MLTLSHFYGNFDDGLQGYSESAANGIPHESQPRPEGAGDTAILERTQGVRKNTGEE
jgi:hypothetical protein